MTSNLTPSFVRTLVPIAVGPLVARFFPGVDINDPNTLLLVSGIVSYVYYVVVRYAEMYNPKLGLLLGISKQPAYSTESAPSPAAGEEVVAVVVDEEQLP